MNGRYFAPPLTRTNMVILWAIVATFLIQSFVQNMMGVSFASIWGLSLYGMSRGHLFEIFTYPLVSSGLMEMIFNGLLFWFVGGQLEGRWGAKHYRVFLGVCVLAGAISYLFVSYFFLQDSSMALVPLIGVHGILSAILWVYAMIFPEQQFAFMLIFPIKAKYFVLLLIFIELYLGAVGGFVFVVPHLATLLLGWAYAYFILRERQIPWAFPQIFKQERKVSKKNHLRIVESEKEKEKDPKYWQ